MRALEYKSQGKIEFATILFKALLETRVLNEGISEDKNNEKLKSIRYNCVKNLAIIHQDQNEDELALEYFIKAMDLDETEVHTMHRLGQLALKKKHLDLADHAFQKCLDRNPNHWPSIDGMLLTLCAMNNIMGAYGWALKYYQKDESYDRAVDVLVEITERWPGMVDFFKIVWKHEFTIPEGKTSEGKDSAFPLNLYDIPEDDLKVVKPNLEEFQVESLTWQSVGEFIVRVYKHLEDTKQCILFPLYIDDILRTTSESIEETIVPEEKEKEVSDVEEVLNPPQDDDLVMIQEDGTEVPITEPMESNDSTEDNAPTKPKSRRRCSDLSNLEQWGWHKNKRYSTRKKSNQEKEVDTTVNGYLRKIFAPFFTETFDNQSPFLLEKRIDEIDTENNSDDDENKADKTLKDFETEKKADFERFLKEAKESHLDLILIIYLWIKYISNYWNQELPEDIRKIYYEIYGFYL
ncbi:CABIN1 family protein [Megaselia abdita]